MNWSRCLLAGASSVLLSCGFLSRPPVNNYYLLDYLPTPQLDRKDKQPYPYEVRVKDFEIAEAFRRRQIIYRQSAHQMQFYDYHRWAVDPEFMVGELLVKHLKASKLFANVLRSFQNFVPTFVLSGKVLALEEFDSREQWFAHLAVEYKLEDTQTNKIIWSRTYDLRKTVAQQEPVYVVRELSSLLEFVHDKVIESLAVVLDEYHYNRQVPAPAAATEDAEP